jgi:hypothetical protein
VEEWLEVLNIKYGGMEFENYASDYGKKTRQIQLILGSDCTQDQLIENLQILLEENKRTNTLDQSRRTPVSVASNNGVFLPMNQHMRFKIILPSVFTLIRKDSIKRNKTPKSISNSQLNHFSLLKLDQNWPRTPYIVPCVALLVRADHWSPAPITSLKVMSLLSVQRGLRVPPSKSASAIDTLDAETGGHQGSCWIIALQQCGRGGLMTIVDHMH